MKDKNTQGNEKKTSEDDKQGIHIYSMETEDADAAIEALLNLLKADGAIILDIENLEGNGKQK
ncbi:hypothetical protein BZZ01_13515 [Nostocales cyanobacterium HT-58-2]|nr:hypothetical protein BZZ01_13515 [Nostocales cyanobacterium HT-58-2]